MKSVGAFWIFARAIERASDIAHLNNKKAIAAVGSRKEDSNLARNLVQVPRGGRKAERAGGGTQ